MARSYANIATAIWRDDDFKALNADEQWAYLLFVSQPDISAAGVLTLALARWASRAKGMTRERLTVAIEGLEANRFVVVDHETDELLVRSFVRWDGGYTNSKRRFAIRDAAAHIESAALRRALAAEFARLELPAEWIPEFSHVDSPSDALSDGACDSPSDAVPASRRVVVTRSKREVPATHNPQQATLVPSRNADPPASGRKQGTRLPDDFAVTAEMVTWAREHTPHVDGRYETAKFIDYWRGKSGKDATKTDWVATWRNWMRKAAERQPDRAGPRTTDDRVNDFVSAGRRLQALHDQQQNDPRELTA